MLAKLFGLGRPASDPRALLVEALSDIAGEPLAQKAGEYFDFPERFEQACEAAGTEALWVLEGKKPTPGAKAQGIFQQMLEDSGHAGFIDWADDAESILDAIQPLLRNAGAEMFSPEERSRLLSLAADARRGKAFGKLDEPLRQAVRARGLVLSYLDRDADAYYPVVVSLGTYEKWSRLCFDSKRTILQGPPP
ncbi:hypothetical protein C3942_05130 [Solimonas fluminis]|uniref:DUF6630 domain-containing protein n=1 Tax=Solimonas fluminis TaxID=2086571 RepID=A0A2S5TJ94_9GAMM|nr:hypothetical protein [Solimonas fluminis]PPE75060.1 hypothetical protein C3942_05130 [Solimonas fluminis]